MPGQVARFDRRTRRAPLCPSSGSGHASPAIGNVGVLPLPVIWATSPVALARPRVTDIWEVQLASIRPIAIPIGAGSGSRRWSTPSGAENGVQRLKGKHGIRDPVVLGKFAHEPWFLRRT